MKHSNSLITTSEALRRVFISALEPKTTYCYRAIRTSRSYPLPWPYRLTPAPCRLYQFRHASTSRMGGYMASVDNGEESEPRRDRPPRDEEIKAFKICIVRQEDNRLSEPVPTYEALQSRQRDDKGRPTQFLQEVAPINVEAGRYYPICRMFDKKAVHEAEIAKRKAAKEKRVQKKQLEVSWTMSDNDLSHRLGRLKEFLEKGWRVEMLFGTKRKGWMGRREASKEEIRRVLERIRGAVGEVDGAREWRGMQGKEGGEAILNFEGKATK